MKKSKIIRIRNIGVIVSIVIMSIMIISALITGIEKPNYYGLDKDNFSIDALTEEQKIKVSGFGNAHSEHWRGGGDGNVQELSRGGQ